MMKFLYILGEKTEKVKEEALQIAEELHIELSFFHTATNRTTAEYAPIFLKLYAEAEARGVDLILCRGSMESVLRTVLPDSVIPILPIQFLGSSAIGLLADVMEHHPEEFSKPLVRVSILSHVPLVLDQHAIRFLMHTEMKDIVIKTRESEEIRSILKEEQKQGTDFIICGPAIKTLAEEMGLHAYFNPSSDEYESQLKTFQQAIIIVENLRQQRERSRLLENIMNYSFEAVLQVDRQGAVRYSNTAADQILEKENRDILGRKLWELIPELTRELLEGSMEQEEKKYACLIRFGDRILVVNILSYIKDEKIEGAIVQMDQKERLDKLEGQIKSELYKKGLVARYHFGDILHQSEKMQECIYQAKQFSKHSANVLLFGESGTGKELFAQSIHNFSSRCSQPFVAVNCGALPVNLLESELFGYVGGAFTGAAKQGKKGLIEMADHGTIFLDEISEMDLQGQIRLLRVLEERVITKIGDDKVIPVDVRIVAATNKNLRKLISEGKFRADLYYRLNVLTVKIPPLRERREDIDLLTDHFLRHYGEKNSKTLVLTDEAYAVLRAYSWPGNVRQLRNFCERLVIIADGREVSAAMVRRQLGDIDQEEPAEAERFLTTAPGAAVTATDASAAAYFAAGAGGRTGPAAGNGWPETRGGLPPLSPLELSERQNIREALFRAGGNRQQAAALLGIGRSSLWRKMKKYHLE